MRGGVTMRRSVFSGGVPAVISSASEPVFGQDPTDTMLVNEPFDEYSTASDFWAQQTTSGVHLGDPGNEGVLSTATRTGTGKCYSFFYDTTQFQPLHKLTTFRDGHAFYQDAQNPWTDITNGGKTVIVQDWRRIVTTADVGQFGEFAIKHMEFVLPITSNIRQLFCTGDHLPADPVWNSGAIFKCLGKDETEYDGGQSYQSPSVTDIVRAGAWYQSTWMYRAHSGPTTKDGEARLWVAVPSLGIPKTELVRIRQDAVGVTPPNADVHDHTGGSTNWKPWCTQLDVDKLSLGNSGFEQGVGAINMWHQLVNAGSDMPDGFNVYSDDIQIWTRGP